MENINENTQRQERRAAHNKDAMIRIVDEHNETYRKWIAGDYSDRFYQSETRMLENQSLRLLKEMRSEIDDS